MKKEFFVCDICNKRIDGNRYERNWRIFSPNYSDDSDYHDISDICEDCEDAMNLVMWKTYNKLEKTKIKKT